MNHPLRPAVDDPQRALPVAQGARPSRQQTAAGLLQRIRDNHLSIRRDWDAMQADFNERRTAMGRGDVFLRPHELKVYRPRTEEERAQTRAWLDDAATVQPDSTEAKSLLARVSAALDQGLVTSEARVAIALMIDAYPNARPHSPEAYIASIMDALQGEDVPTVAVSWACDELKTTTPFLPSLAELIAKVKAAAKSLNLYRRWLEHYLEWSRTSSEAGVWLESVELETETAKASANG